MTTTTFENEFMTSILQEEAWKELSREYPWNEKQLDSYKELVSWEEVSENRSILWTPSMLEKFKNRINWDEISNLSTNSESYILLYTADNFKKFKGYWNWSKLSYSLNMEIFNETFESFLDLWDWNEIIDNYHLEDILNMDFLLKYQSRIPIANLQQSCLWRNLRDSEMRKIRRNL